MRSYSEVHGVFSSPMITVHRMTTELVAAMPDKYLDKEVRCHEVARSVLRHLKWVGEDETMEIKLYDGKYTYVEHSWLVLLDPFVRKTAILDPYAVGRLPQVQLVSPSVTHYQLYEAGKRRTDIWRGAAAYLHDTAVSSISAGH